MCDERIQLAPGLIFVADMNIIVTAERPLSSLESFTGRASGIFPGSKFAMELVPSNVYEDTKFNYTTGICTKRNYIQKKAGQKAEFHHTYGALIVEVESDGTWFVRQLNGDGRNRIQDIDVIAENGEVYIEAIVKGIVGGDTHAVEADPEAVEAIFGEGGVVDTVQPETYFHHDFFSMRSQNKYDLKKFGRRFEKYVKGQGSVIQEAIESAALYREKMHRDYMTSYFVHSNHHDHIEQYLDLVDYKHDLENAEIHLEMRLAQVQAIKAGKEDSFLFLEWLMRRVGLTEPVEFLRSDESVVICPDRSGGIECGAYHGDKGAGGKPGSLTGFAKLARRVCVGHTHSAGIYNGVYMVGTTSQLRLPYNSGPSSWSHTLCLIYSTGKRALVTISRGRAWASRAGLY